MSDELLLSTTTELPLCEEFFPVKEEFSTTQTVVNEAEEVLDGDVQLIDLLHSWGLSSNALIEFNRCGIKNVKILQIMHSHDIDEILNTRDLIADKIKFRYNLQKWRLENNFDMLTCCSGDRFITNLSSIQTRLCTASTPSNSPNNEPSVEEILKETVAGNDLLKKYENCGCLQESDQSTIVRIIVDNYLKRDIKMTPFTLKTVAEQIVKLFPTEQESVYYVPRTNKKNPTGKLHDRYFNSLYKRKVQMQNYPPPKIFKATVVNDESSTKFNETKQYLQQNIPKNICVLWKETSEVRIKEPKCRIQDILKEWPRYCDTSGYQLVDIDFETMFSGKSDLMLNKIESIEKAVKKVLFHSLNKDKLSVTYYDAMLVASDANCRHYYFFNLLHAVITPPRVNKNIKPSITDAQMDMMTHLINNDKLQQTLDELNKSARKEGSTLSPRVFVIGENPQNLKEFYVCVDKIKYQVESLIKAVDLVIKISFVFNIQYSAKSKYVWVFLQRYVYDICSEEKFPKIENILNRLKNIQQKHT